MPAGPSLQSRLLRQRCPPSPAAHSSSHLRVWSRACLLHKCRQIQHPLPQKLGIPSHIVSRAKPEARDSLQDVLLARCALCRFMVQPALDTMQRTCSTFGSFATYGSQINLAPEAVRWPAKLLLAPVPASGVRVSLAAWVLSATVSWAAWVPWTAAS